MRYYDRTDLGRGRKVNQDRTGIIVNNKNQLLAILCDGMGGHQSGDLAARIVCDYMINCFEAMHFFSSNEEGVAWLKGAVKEANDMVYRLGNSNLMHKGMGTTLVALLIIDQKITVTSIGDSRAYVYGKNHLQQVTQDDTLVNMLLKSGSITKEQAKDHPQKNVLMQAIGVADRLESSLITIPYEEQIIMLCSDGLYNYVNEKQIVDILNEEQTPKHKVDQLIKTANDNIGLDNIGVIVIEIEKGDIYE